METIEYKGYTIKIDYDDDLIESPLEWTTPEERGSWFVLYHRHYNLPLEIDVNLNDYTSWTDVANNHPEIKNKPVKFVRWFEHSGVAVSLRDDESGTNWDAGIVGIIVGETTEHIESAFNEWKMYIEGDIYNYTVTDIQGKHVDSLGGIFGYAHGVELAKKAVDYDLKHNRRANHHPQKASGVHV